MRSGRVVVVAAVCFIAGAALAGLTAFLLRQGVERASWWAGIFGLFVSVFGLGFTLLTGLRQEEVSAKASRLASLDDQPVSTGQIGQFNSGGVNIANTGISGDIQVNIANTGISGDIHVDGPGR